jgi:hypothetical protein
MVICITVWNVPVRLSAHPLSCIFFEVLDYKLGPPDPLFRLKFFLRHFLNPQSIFCYPFIGVILITHYAISCYHSNEFPVFSTLHERSSRKSQVFCFGELCLFCEYRLYFYLGMCTAVVYCINWAVVLGYLCVLFLGEDIKRRPRRINR